MPKSNTPNLKLLPVLHILNKYDLLVSLVQRDKHRVGMYI